MQFGPGPYIFKELLVLMAKKKIQSSYYYSPFCSSNTIGHGGTSCCKELLYKLQGTKKDPIKSPILFSFHNREVPKCLN